VATSETPPPSLDPRFDSDAPPARLRVPIGWDRLVERAIAAGARQLGAASMLTPFGSDGRCLVAVSSLGPEHAELISWVDPGSAPMPFGADRVAFLSRLAGTGLD
jgi:hypothetical protein